MAGADQGSVSPRLQDQTLVQRTGQLMYQLSLLYPAISGTRPEWAWSYAFDDTVDGLPYHRARIEIFQGIFSRSDSRATGAAAAWLAARLLLRHLTEAPAKGDDLFGFSRILSGR